MRKLIGFVFCSLLFTSLNIQAQEKFAIIDLSHNYEAGLTNDNYYSLFKLSSSYSLKQIEDFKEKTLKYNYVISIDVVKSLDGYDVKLLLDKKTENISGFFRDYLLSLSLNKIVLDDKKINTVDYYYYLSEKLNHKEVSK